MSASRFFFGVSDFAATEPLIHANTIIASGMDFIEPGLAKAAAMPVEEFQIAVDRLRSDSVAVLSMNWFLPGTLKVTGPNVDVSASRAFLSHALARAQTLDAKAIVFGSPNSRSIPDGFSADLARQQMVSFCHLCADIIAENQWGMKIALEHVNHTETNFLNTFAQTLDIVRQIDRPEIGLAADFYHFAMENESSDAMLDAGDLIHAVQVANPLGRCFPRLGDAIPEMERFFRNLEKVGYQGGVSVEANCGDDLSADCRAAVAFLSSLCDACG